MRKMRKKKPSTLISRYFCVVCKLTTFLTKIIEMANPNEIPANIIDNHNEEAVEGEEEWWEDVMNAFPDVYQEGNGF